MRGSEVQVLLVRLLPIAAAQHSTRLKLPLDIKTHGGRESHCTYKGFITADRLHHPHRAAITDLAPAKAFLGVQGVGVGGR